jgi:hypothetical protein
MELLDSLGAALQSAFSQVASRIAEYTPNLLGAVALLLSDGSSPGCCADLR